MNIIPIIGAMPQAVGRSRFAIGSSLLGLVIASMATIAFANGQLSGF